MNEPKPSEPTESAVRSSGLLACPFCGLTDKDSVSPEMGYVPAVALNQWPHSTFAVQCEGCGCSGPLAKNSENAVNEWNTRKQANVEVSERRADDSRLKTGREPAVRSTDGF